MFGNKVVELKTINPQRIKVKAQGRYDYYNANM